MFCLCLLQMNCESLRNACMFVGVASSAMDSYLVHFPLRATVHGHCWYQDGQ